MRKLIVSAAALVLLILVGVTVSGCGGSSSNTPPVVNPLIVSLSISPSTATLHAGETTQFTASVTGTSQVAVIWSVMECAGTACGTINATGLYTAPSEIPNKGTVTVVATMQADSTKTAKAAVNHMPPSEAQGVYSGTSFYAQKGSFYSIVLPNDMYYAFYTAVDPLDSSDRAFMSSMMAGWGQAADGTYKANLTNFFTDSSFPVTLKATYVPGVSMNGSIEVVANGYTTTFNGTAPPAYLFEWNVPANLVQITGTWQGSTTSISIDPSGTFTGKEGACNFSGTIVPDSNRNFFRLNITYGDSPCLTNMANQQGSGIMIETLLSDGITRQLLAGAPVGGWRCIIAAQR